MIDCQKSIIHSLFFRKKHSLPVGALRMYPSLKRTGSYATESIESEEQLYEFLKFNKDIFINLFSDDQKKSKMYDMIFLDIDDMDLTASFSKLQTVLTALENHGISNYITIFSGSKGFHVYVPFTDTLLSNYRYAILEWLKSIKIRNLVDTKALEDNRVVRVPYSFNLKSGNLCYVVDIAKCDNLNDVLSKKFKLENIDIKPNIDLGKILKTFDKIEISESDLGIIQFGVCSDMFDEFDKYPKCMQILFKEAMEGTDLGHHERLELGKFLLHVYGGNVDKVADFYYRMSDYNDRKTKYHLKYIRNRNLKMWKCENMIKEGLCPYTSSDQAKCNCLFYPSINNFMRD